MARIWDLYLDVDDAAAVLHAAAVLERHDAIREPLPFDDAERLLARLRTVARIADEEATSWGYEIEDRRAEASADGGRWGSRAVAETMFGIALQRAAGSREVAEAAGSAASDLAARLAGRSPSDTRQAEAATQEQARRLLRTGKLDPE